MSVRSSWAVGSSPHTRGAPRSRPRTQHEGGIIPAYAGSTGSGEDSSVVSQDHPRIRGEHLPRELSRRHAHGSSPHTRGALGCPRDDGFDAGIIPAYAGSTPASHRGSGTSPDHPRIRGEHGGDSFRGIAEHGIIPAYAGSTTRRPPSRRSTPDHPRIRGEHGTNDAADYARPGSSPHTRGAPGFGRVRRRRRRIIPAYAGSTPTRPGYPFSIPDHPRIRGEHACLERLLDAVGGSSPHTRGAPLAG